MTAPLRRPLVADGARAFQPDLDRLVDEPAPFILRLWPVLGAALISALVYAAAVLQVDVVVTASGRVAADAPPVILQPMTRAVLRELLVKPGDVVVAGQLLARLDPTMTEADRAAMQVARDALAAEEARLRAELAGVPLAPSSPDLALQAEVQAERAGLALAQRNQLQAVQTALQQALAAETDAGRGLQDRLAIARQIETMRQELALRQTGSRLAAMEARLARIEAEAAQDQHDARLQDLTQRLAQSSAALAAFDSDQRRQKAEALAALAPRLAEMEEQLSKAQRLATLADLTAPRPGVVLSVAKGGPGSSMGEGDPVVVLVPSDVALIAEIGIRSSETGLIATGDPVTIKIDAFPWRRHGMLEGALLDVSPASFTPEGGSTALHSGRVSLGGALTDLPPGTGLLPGMTLSAEIKTGTRSVLDYFLDPLLRGLHESLREP